jgi:hypothetical protein
LIQQIAPFAATVEFLGKHLDFLGALGAIGPLDIEVTPTNEALFTLARSEGISVV